MPSIDNIEPKKSACETGAVETDFWKWSKFAPRPAHFIMSAYLSNNKERRVRLTVPSRTGTDARIASTKKIEMITGPLLGSALKMWCISDSLPYLNGFTTFGTPASALIRSSRSKTWLLKACVEPNDAMTIVAFNGFVECRN